MILTCPSCGARFRAGIDKLGAAGRKVRCSRCSHVWHATQEEGEPEAGERVAETPPEERAEEGAPSDFAAMAREAMGQPEAAAEAHDGAPGGPADGPGPPPLAPDQDDMDAYRQARREAMRRRHSRAEPARSGRRRGVLGWLLLLLAVAGLATGGWFGRYEIVDRVPAAAQLYDLAGIAIDPVAPGLELRDITRSRRLVDGQDMLVLEGQVVNVASTTRQVPLLQVTLFDERGNRLTAWTFAAEASSLAPDSAANFATQIENPPEEAREISLTFAQPG